MIRPISFGTRLGFGVPCAELVVAAPVVDVGPDEALLLLAAEAEPGATLQAVAAKRIKTRI